MASTGQGISVGIATRYGLDGPGIETRWGALFSAPIQTGPGAHPAFLYNGYRVFPWGKAAGAWNWPPTPSSAEVKERIEIYLYSSLGLRGLLQGELYLQFYLYLSNVGFLIFNVHNALFVAWSYLETLQVLMHRLTKPFFWYKLVFNSYFTSDDG